MSGPWEKYSAPADGPWTKFAAPKEEAPGDVPTEENVTKWQTEKPKEYSAVDKLRGGVEAAAATITSPANLLGPLTGNRITGYQPRTEAGQDYTERVGQAIDESKLAGLAPEGPSIIRGAPAAGKATQTALGASRTLAEALKKPEQEMVGMGAATTTGAAQREAEAGGLDVPIKPTLGQKTRDFGQNKFERETAKDEKLGGPLRQRFAEQNERVLKNFDSWVDQLGAESPNIRSVGKTVDDALVKRVKEAKTNIRMAYQKAKQTGAMDEKVGMSEISDYLSKTGPESINAPILKSVRDKLVQVGALKELNGKIVPSATSINDLEEVRKMINRLVEPGTPNSVYGKELKSLIDKATEGKGGDAYKAARKLRADFASEFENKAVVDKLLRNKPGTTDRAVAFEDVFSHSILNGSADDVSSIRQTLLRGGQEGRKGWVELQGATINHIKDATFSSVKKDINGNPIPSPAQLNKVVRELDKDGKLDLIFGKRDANKIRDLNKVVGDLYVPPEGTVNTSNTTSTLITALKKVSEIGGKLPGPVGAVSKYAVNKGINVIENAKTQKKLEEALR